MKLIIPMKFVITMKFVIANGVKQSPNTRNACLSKVSCWHVDCFVVSLLAMTRGI